MAKTKKRKKARPRCLLIAGPNGAGKTTFAREYLPNDARVLNFVNADLIATALSPLKPELAAVAAARLVLKEIDRLTNLRGLREAQAPPDLLRGLGRWAARAAGAIPIAYE